MAAKRSPAGPATVRRSASEAKVSSGTHIELYLDNARTILEELRVVKEAHSGSGSIIRTNRNKFILPRSFNQYIMCTVVPYHIFSGNAKDCIKLVLRLLPSDEYGTIA